jgi:hypothetical protein
MNQRTLNEWRASGLHLGWCTLGELHSPILSLVRSLSRMLSSHLEKSGMSRNFKGRKGFVMRWPSINSLRHWFFLWTGPTLSEEIEANISIGFVLLWAAKGNLNLPERPSDSRSWSMMVPVQNFENRWMNFKSFHKVLNNAVKNQCRFSHKLLEYEGLW